MLYKIVDLRWLVLIIIGIWIVFFLIVLFYLVYIWMLFYEYSFIIGKLLYDFFVCIILLEWIFEMIVMF